MAAGVAVTQPASGPARPVASASQPLTSPGDIKGQPALPTPTEVRQVVRQLSHPLRDQRRVAIRQLAEWGPLAFDELKRAAQGRDLEAALLARDLLTELKSAILIGAHIRLAVDRTEINWDEPIALTIYARSPVAAEMRVPWPAPQPGTTTQPAADDVTQVAAMMDAADFLVVTGPDGQRIDPRIEPIECDRAVYEAVDQRARGTPPSHVIAPGQTACLRVPLLNRGWARYPMLATGRYTIAFAYQPEWTDESWTEDGFGLVRAEPVIVQVRTGAPAKVRSADRPASLLLRQEAHQLVVEIESTWDVPQWINLNLGSELSVQGRIEWGLIRVADDQADAVTLGPDATLPEVRPELIRRLEPGGTLTVARIAAAELRQRARRERETISGTFDLTVRYTHVATPDQLREQLRANQQAGDVPAHVFSGSLVSEPIQFSLGDKDD